MCGPPAAESFRLTLTLWVVSRLVPPHGSPHSAVYRTLCPHGEQTDYSYPMEMYVQAWGEEKPGGKKIPLEIDGLTRWLPRSVRVTSAVPPTAHRSMICCPSLC